jgi:thioredoxin
LQIVEQLSIEIKQLRMTGSVTIVPEDSQFQIELGNAENKLVVVDFTASWCGPCQRIAPFFAEMAGKYARAVFLKVDVDQCPETASSQGVTAMPTFIFYRSRVKIGQVTGADQSALEAKIQHFLEGDDGSDGDSGVQGHLDLVSFLNKSGCECLNESLDHPLANCLQSGAGFLESDCDEQLIISLDFNQPVKLHSLKIKAPAGNGPKNIRLFINHPRTLGFDEADSMEPAQMIELQAGDLEGNVVPLRFVKFQNVHNFQVVLQGVY